MSDRNNSPPFERGETFYGGRTIDTNNFDGLNYEGMLKVFEDINLNATSPGAKPARTGKAVTCMCVRNMTGVAVLPKRLVQLDDSTPGRVTGYAVASSQHCYPVDEFLPATGAPNGDLFYIVVKGPAMCLTPLAGSAQNDDIAAGALLHSATLNTASTTSATTSGRVATFSAALAAATTNTAAVIVNFGANFIGRAISAKTTGQTNADILVDIKGE